MKAQKKNGCNEWIITFLFAKYFSGQKAWRNNRGLEFKLHIEKVSLQLQILRIHGIKLANNNSAHISYMFFFYHSRGHAYLWFISMQQMVINKLIDNTRLFIFMVDDYVRRYTYVFQIRKKETVIGKGDGMPLLSSMHTKIEWGARKTSESMLFHGITIKYLNMRKK